MPASGKRLRKKARQSAMVASMPFLWVLSTPCDAETPGPINPTLKSLPALRAAEPSEP